MRFLDALDGLGGWGDGDGYGTAGDTRAISRDGLVPSRVQTAGTSSVGDRAPFGRDRVALAKIINKYNILRRYLMEFPSRGRA